MGVEKANRLTLFCLALEGSKECEIDSCSKEYLSLQKKNKNDYSNVAGDDSKKFKDLMLIEGIRCIDKKRCREECR